MFDICVYDGAQVLLNQRLWPNKRCALTHGPDGTTQLVRFAVYLPVLHLPFHSSSTFSFLSHLPLHHFFFPDFY